MQTWKDLNEDDILNYQEATTGLMAQYDRIMNRKLRDSIIELTNTFQKQSDDLKKSIDGFNKTSGTLSERLCWLNVILVVLTLILVVLGIAPFLGTIRKFF